MNNRLCQSTRGFAEAVNFPEAVLTGLAPDGGLYAHGELPVIKGLEGLLQQDNAGIMAEVTAALLPGFPKTDIINAVKDGLTERFGHPDITPLVKIGPAWVLELFHGPTLAFKDVALGVMPRLFLAAKRITGDASGSLILTATSGDTGKAALEGFSGLPGCDVCVFYPHGGVSPIQELQMRASTGDNVHVCAVRGNFDDTQRGVKHIFIEYSEGKPDMKGTKLSSANSINIGRLAPQAGYYFAAYAALLRQGAIKPGQAVDFAVPTGNFGNILAGWIAKRMGLPVGRLICASNENDVLTEFIHTGRYDRRRKFFKTDSPSMDILVSSNLERLLYWLSGNDSGLVAGLMEALAKDGVYEVPQGMRDAIALDFTAARCAGPEAIRVMRHVWMEYNYLLDPHTAVAWSGFEGNAGENPCVVLATASPYKFAPAVLHGIGLPAMEDPFDCVRALGDASGAEPPKGIMDLRNKGLRHNDVIDIDEMEPYVLNIARGKK
ncbi:MAG: threonine synthase [Clostridiales bacterium]|jgi:threonine synthase|nr:threonine synthase [Clostridiales bacterium]